MDYTTVSTNNDRQIQLSGQLTFADHQKFRQIMEIVQQGSVESLTLDFGRVDFIDSAGLGMLLLLRDECQNRQIAVALSAARGQVEKIFLISRFDQLFSMHG